MMFVRSARESERASSESGTVEHGLKLVLFSVTMRLFVACWQFRWGERRRGRLIPILTASIPSFSGFGFPRIYSRGGMLVQLENSDCGRRRRRLKWFRAAAKLRVNARHGVCLCYYSIRRRGDSLVDEMDMTILTNSKSN